MKKLLLILFFLVESSSVYAQVYRHNQWNLGRMTRPGNFKNCFSTCIVEKTIEWQKYSNNRFVHPGDEIAEGCVSQNNDYCTQKVYFVIFTHIKDNIVSFSLRRRLRGLRHPHVKLDQEYRKVELKSGEETKIVLPGTSSILTLKISSVYSDGAQILVTVR